MYGTIMLFLFYSTLLTIVFIIEEDVGVIFLTEEFGGSVLVKTVGILTAFWISKSVDVGIIVGSIGE